MDIYEALDKLQRQALRDEILRSELITTRSDEHPIDAFCAKCREYGFPIYKMDLISSGEDFYAAMRRSTNGGGENSPKLSGEDDFYELFFAALGE